MSKRFEYTLLQRHEMLNKEKQIKTTMKYHFMPTRWLHTNQNAKTSAGENVATGTFIHVQPLWEIIWQLLNILNTVTI